MLKEKRLEYVNKKLKKKIHLQNFIFNNRADTPILKPSLGDSAGVFGAAALVG